MGKIPENCEFRLLKAVNWEFDPKKFENLQSAPPCPPPARDTALTDAIQSVLDKISSYLLNYVSHLCIQLLKTVCLTLYHRTARRCS